MSTPCTTERERSARCGSSVVPSPVCISVYISSLHLRFILHLDLPGLPQEAKMGLQGQVYETEREGDTLIALSAIIKGRNKEQRRLVLTKKGANLTEKKYKKSFL
jgi:hypothetical protein